MYLLLGWMYLIVDFIYLLVGFVYLWVGCTYLLVSCMYLLVSSNIRLYLDIVSCNLTRLNANLDWRLFIIMSSDSRHDLERTCWPIVVHFAQKLQMFLDKIEADVLKEDSFSFSWPVWRDWAIYWTLGKFLKPFATINLPKSTTFLGNFRKGVKI